MNNRLKNIRLLHLGNIANNAYLNSKLLRKKDIKADVLCYDYYYLMGSPEWEEVEIEGDWGSDFNPDWSKINLHGFRRPEWFYQGPLETVASKMIRKENYSPSKKERQTNWLVALYEQLSRSRIGIQLLRTIKIPRLKVEVFFYKYFDKENPNLRYWRSLIKEFKKFFPNRHDQLSLEDILPFANKLEIFKRIFQNYDLIQAYATDPIYPLLTDKHPYVAFEHGTIRDIPFENSPIGRLTALAYRKADLVFITNGDNLAAAKRLGLRNFVPIPHPINEYWHKKSHQKINRTKVILFCPLRHDWQIKGTDLYIRALPQIAKSLKKSFKMYFVNWGMEVDKSEALVKKLKMEKYVSWLKPLARHDLSAWFEKCDIVLDQIRYPHMGATAPEGMLAGKPVLMSYHHESTDWMHPRAPIISVFSKEDIAKTIIDLVNNPQKAVKIGKAGQRWYQQYYSNKIVLERLTANYSKLLRKK